MSSRQALLTLRRMARGKLSTSGQGLDAPTLRSGGAAVAPGLATRDAHAVGSTALQALLSARPQSLHAPHTSDATSAAVEDGQVGLFRRLMLRLGGFYSAESSRMRAALRLQRAILEQADDAQLVQAAHLPVGDFRGSFSLASLHLWLTLVRLRAEGDAGKLLGQELYDHFWEEMEARVRGEGVVVRLSKWMKELESAFYGSCTAYDAALAPGAPEGALAGALRRNVLMEHGGGAESAALARYVRHQLACLAVTDSSAIMSGHISFNQGRSSAKT